MIISLTVPFVFVFLRFYLLNYPTSTGKYFTTLDKSNNYYFHEKKNVG